MRISRAAVGDGALAAALVLFGIVGSLLVSGLPHASARIDWLAIGLVEVAAVALAVRRRWPLQVLVVVAACTSVYLAIGYAYGPILVSFTFAVYAAARHAPASRSAVYALAVLPPLLFHLFVRPTVFGVLYGVVPVCAWIVVPYSLGFALRTRREAADRARAETIRTSVDEERLRVAQEVHDIVGHGLAAIKMQADIALHVLDRKPDQAAPALEAISRTSGDALDELRTTLAVVRRAEQAERTPVPGLGRLDELRQRMAESGVYVRLLVTGRPPRHALPVAVDLTGYRVVQESLTNVLRHSGAVEATVNIAYEDRCVLIVVSNPVRTPPAEGAGSGIAGMRRRVMDLGGEFTAGPLPKDGFEVRARLPLGALGASGGRT
ncbi:sensor histidine kinase [Actinomadura barringtoniae]|uniref:histidine kinase n=1 Tax=Actinomadura barringtoniae TaxID=1427535 RepID=A0A939PLY1_9ACTN|nr:sensor histidine kinase [Actinomadura barringtoniae]MBO2455231.1 sensor histidine kinase [Actinomadura barringtoniae]